VFVDRAFGFTPVAGDDYYIMSGGYADVNLTHVAATAQTAGDLSAQIATAQTDLDELTDTGTLSGVRLALMVDRLYTRLFHEVNVTDSTGAVQIRNSGDTGNVATGSITDDDTTTTQAKFTWA